MGKGAANDLDDWRDPTRLIRAGQGGEIRARTVGPPVQHGSTVLLPNAAALYDWTNFVTYGRQGLAAQEALAGGIKALEGAGHAELYASGMAAISGALLALLRAGDEVLVADCVYAPTRRFCDKVLKRFGISTRYFAGSASPENVLTMAGEATRMILMESPGSLTFEVQDVPGVARLARERGILTAIDNTWAAGVLFKPLAHGVDLSIQALTKYVGGHSDVFLGSVATNDRKLAQQLTTMTQDAGWAVAPDDAYQGLRGLRTLTTRLERHGRSGLQVAEWLQQQPGVARVLHPALPGSPGHEIWARDFSGASGLFGVVMQPAPERAVHAFLDALKLFGLGFSWGGFESLAVYSDPQLARRVFQPGFEGPLLRFHIGLEDPRDLIADLERGFQAFHQAR